MSNLNGTLTPIKKKPARWKRNTPISIGNPNNQIISLIVDKEIMDYFFTLPRNKETASEKEYFALTLL